MAFGRIESADDLRTYLRQARPQRALLHSEIEQIVTSARFEGDQFKGMGAGPLMEKFTEGERQHLIQAFNQTGLPSDTLQ